MAVYGSDVPCYYPNPAYQTVYKNARGKSPISFKKPNGEHKVLQLPCGQCIGCRLERSRQWALRCVHESKMHENNSFITLTYDPANQPDNGGLSLDDFQKFMKRFRKAVEPKKVRFFACGEYGESLEHSKNGKLGHPHYHACVFGYDFPDKYPFKKRDEHIYYRSPLLETLWPFGHSIIGNMTFETAAYTARYVMKKHLGKDKKDHYEYVDKETGEAIQLKPEFTVMSRRPGIGKPWYDKYKKDLRKDFITERGVKMRPPKFYDKQLENEEPERFEEVKAKRKIAALENQHDDYYDRLEAGAKIKAKKMKQLIRDL